MKTITRLYGLFAVVLAYGAMAQGTFNYGYQTVFDSQASDYIVSTANVQRYSEWQSPPTTYWGPSANDVQGTLTYRFDFGAPSASISLFLRFADSL